MSIGTYGLAGARAGQMYSRDDTYGQRPADRIRARLDERLNRRRLARQGQGLVDNRLPPAPAAMEQLAPQVSPQPELPESSFGMKALGALGNALDLPGSMVRDVVTLNNPFDQLLSPFSPDNRTSGEDIRKSLGILPEESESVSGSLGRFGLDLGVEVALDPLTYMSFGLTAAMKGASAGAKGARTLSKTGLIDDAAEAASKKLGRKVGKREALLNMSSQDVIDFSRQAAPARSKAAAAKRSADFEGSLQREIKKVAEGKKAATTKAIKDAKLSEGYARFRLPYGLVDVSFGGEKAARAMDVAGEGLRYSKPIRAANVVLNKKMKGRYTKKGQIAAEQESKELLENRAVARGRLAAPMLGISSALGDKLGRVDEERIGSLMYDYLEDVGREGVETVRGVDPDTGKEIVVGKTFSEPLESFAARDKFVELRDRGLVEHLDVIKEEYATALDTAQKSGVPVEMLDDEFISYAARQRNAAETPFGRADQSSGYEVKTANATKRRDYLRGMPGGTSALQKMSLNIDPATGKTLLPDEGGIAGSLDTAKEAGEKVGAAVTKRRKEKFAEVYGVPEEKVDKLYSLMAGRPFKQVAEGKPLFVADPSQAALSSIQSLYEASGEATGLSKFLRDNAQLKDTPELQRLKSEAQDSHFVKTTDDQDIATSGLNVFADFIYNNLKGLADPLRRVTIRNVDDGSGAAKPPRPKPKDPKSQGPKPEDPKSQGPKPEPPVSQGDDYREGIELLANLSEMDPEEAYGYEDLIRRLSDSESRADNSLATTLLRERPDIADVSLRNYDEAGELSATGSAASKVEEALPVDGKLIAQSKEALEGMTKPELDTRIRLLKQRNGAKYGGIKATGAGATNIYKREQILKAVENGDMELNERGLFVKRASSGRSSRAKGGSPAKASSGRDRAGTRPESPADAGDGASQAEKLLGVMNRSKLNKIIEELHAVDSGAYGKIQTSGRGTTNKYKAKEIFKAVENGDIEVTDKGLAVKGKPANHPRPAKGKGAADAKKADAKKVDAEEADVDPVAVAEEQVKDANLAMATTIHAAMKANGVETEALKDLIAKLQGGEIAVDSPALRNGAGDVAEAAGDIAAESLNEVEGLLGNWNANQLNVRVSILQKAYPDKYKNLKKVGGKRTTDMVAADLLKAFKAGDLELDIDGKLLVKMPDKPNAPKAAKAAPVAGTATESQVKGLVDKLSARGVNERLKRLKALDPEKYGHIKLSGKGVTNAAKKEQLLGFAASGDLVVDGEKGLRVKEAGKRATEGAPQKLLSPEQSKVKGKALAKKLRRTTQNRKIRLLREAHEEKYGSGSLDKEFVSDDDALGILNHALEEGDLVVSKQNRLVLPEKPASGAPSSAEDVIAGGGSTTMSVDEVLTALRSTDDPTINGLADAFEAAGKQTSDYAGRATTVTEDDVRFGMLMHLLPDYDGEPVENFGSLLTALRTGNASQKGLATRLRRKFKKQDGSDESLEALEAGLASVEDLYAEDLADISRRFLAMETDELPETSLELVKSLFNRGDAKGYALAEKIAVEHSSNPAMKELAEKYATIKPGTGRSIARQDGRLNKAQKSVLNKAQNAQAVDERAATRELGRAERFPRKGDSLAQKYRLFVYTGKLPETFSPEDAKDIVRRRIDELEYMKRAGYTTNFANGNRPIDMNAVEEELASIQGRFGGMYKSGGDLYGPTLHLFPPEELARMVKPDDPKIGANVTWERGSNANATKPKLLVELAKKVHARVKESGNPSETKRMGKGVGANRHLLMEVFNKEPMKEVAELIDDIRGKLTTGAEMSKDEQELALAFLVNDELPHGVGHFADVPESVKSRLRTEGVPGKPTDTPPSVVSKGRAAKAQTESMPERLKNSTPEESWDALLDLIGNSEVDQEHLSNIAKAFKMTEEELLEAAASRLTAKHFPETLEQTSRYYGGIAGARIGLSDQSFFADAVRGAMGEGYLSAYGSVARDIAAALQNARLPGQRLADVFGSNHPALEQVKRSIKDRQSFDEISSALRKYDEQVDLFNEAATSLVDDDAIATIIRDAGVAAPAMAQKGTRGHQEYFTGLADQMLRSGNPVHASRLRAIGNPLSDASGRMLGSGRFEDYEFPELIGKFANNARRVSYQDEYGYNSIEALLSARPEIFREMVADAQSLIGRDTRMNFGHAAPPYSKLPRDLIDANGMARATADEAESATSQALRQMDQRNPGAMVMSDDILNPAGNSLGLSADEVKFLGLPELLAKSGQVSARELADHIDSARPKVTVRYRESVDPSSAKFIQTDAEDYLEMHVDVGGEPVHMRSKIEDAGEGVKLLAIEEAQGAIQGPAFEASIRTAVNMASDNGIDGVRVSQDAAPQLEKIVADTPGLELAAREDGSVVVMIGDGHRQAKASRSETLFQAGDSDEKLARIVIPGPDQDKWFENHLRTHIEAYKKADARSLMHELGHLMRKTMRALGDNKLEQLQEMMKKHVKEPGTETLPDGSFNWNAFAVRPDGSVPDTGKYTLEEAFADIVMEHMTSKASAAASAGGEEPGAIKAAVEMFKDYIGASYSRVKQAPEAEEITDEITKFLDEVIGEENYYMRRPGNTAQFLDALKFGSVRLMNRVADDLGSEKVDRAEQVVIKKRLDDIKMATDDFTSVEDDRYQMVLDEYQKRKLKVVSEFEAANGRKPSHFEVPDLMRKEGEFEGIDMGVSLKETLSQFEIDRKYAEDIQRVMTNGQALAKFANTSRFIQFVDGIQNTFKTNVTATNPGFHGRNLISGIFQNILNDVTDPDTRGVSKFLKPYLDARDLMLGRPVKGLADSAPNLGFVKGQDEEATTELIRLAYAHGVLESPSQQYDIVGASGQFASDIMPSGAALKGTKKPDGLLDLIAQKGKRNSPAKRSENLNMFKVAGGFSSDETFALARYGRATGDVTEGLHRLGGFTALIKQGYSPAEAAKRMKLLHVDYTNLSEVERQVLRRVFPFYSFSRGMTEYLVKELANRPAGNVGKTIRAANITRKKDPAMPDYVASGISIPVGESADGTKSYVSGLGLMHEQPVSLLDPIISGNVQESLFEIGSNLSPLIKGPLELMFNESLFQQSPQGGRSLDDLDPLVGRTLSNVGNSLGLTDRKEPYDIGKLPEAIASNSPVSRYLSTVRTIADPRKSIGQRLSPIGLGQRFSTISPAAQDAVLRERATQLMRELGGKVFERSYIPEEVMASMSPEDREKAEQYMTLMKMLGNRAKQRKAVREMQEQQENN